MKTRTPLIDWIYKKSNFGTIIVHPLSIDKTEILSVLVKNWEHYNIIVLTKDKRGFLNVLDKTDGRDWQESGFISFQVIQIEEENMQSIYYYLYNTETDIIIFDDVNLFNLLVPYHKYQNTTHTKLLVLTTFGDENIAKIDGFSFLSLYGTAKLKYRLIESFVDEKIISLIDGIISEWPKKQLILIDNKDIVEHIKLSLTTMYLNGLLPYELHELYTIEQLSEFNEAGNGILICSEIPSIKLSGISHIHIFESYNFLSIHKLLSVCKKNIGKIITDVYVSSPDEKKIAIMINMYFTNQFDYLSEESKILDLKGLFVHD